MTEDEREIQRRLAALPTHNAPAALLTRLKEIYLPLPWWHKILNPLIHPGWKPLGTLAALALLVGLWFVRANNNHDDSVSLEPLLAAHSRYQAENLVPSGDLMASDFSAQLAVYYGEKE